MSAAGRDLDPPAGFSVPYALQTLIDELTLPPVVIRDGEAVEIEPLAPAGVVDFGDPIGEAETIYTLHSEMLTFADSFGCREGSFRLSLAPGPARAPARARRRASPRRSRALRAEARAALGATRSRCTCRGGRRWRAACACAR